MTDATSPLATAAAERGESCDADDAREPLELDTLRRGRFALCTLALPGGEGSLSGRGARPSVLMLRGRTRSARELSVVPLSDDLRAALPPCCCCCY